MLHICYRKDKSQQVTYAKVTKNSIEFKSVDKEKKDTASVLPVLAKCFGGTFAFASFLSLIRDLLTFTSPQLLR